MKSLKTRISSQVLISSLLLLVPVLAVCLYFIYSIQDQSSDEIVRQHAIVNTQSLNQTLTDVEIGVHTLTSYISVQLDGHMDDFFSREYRDEHCRQVCEVAKSSITLTEGATSIYYALNIEIAEDDEGFYLVEDPEVGELVVHPRTPIKQYDEEDVSNVGWYYQPAYAGHDLWMKPYHNAQNKKGIISFVSPIYVDGIFVGVMGIDLDFGYVDAEIDEIAPYTTGYAFLLSEDYDILYHPEYPDGLLKEDQVEGYKLFDEKVAQSLKDQNPFRQKLGDRPSMKYMPNELKNGMILVIAVPTAEINRYGRSAILISIGFTLIFATLVLLIVGRTTRKMLSPIDEIVDISQELAGGNFDVEIKYNKQDELGTLAESFRKMSGELKKSFNVVQDEAFTDELTGLNNRNSYLKNVELFSSHLGSGAGTCTVYVMDVNNLKILNDTKGHNAGDEMLKTIASIIADVFGRENTFRYGGDEFAAIYSYEDTNPEEKIMDLQLRVSRQSKKDFSKYEMQYQVAAGYAIFDPETDMDFSDTFSRADAQMYGNKKRLKEIYN